MIFSHIYYVDVGKCRKCFSRLNVFVLTPPTTHWKTLASFSAKVHFSRHKAFLLKAKSGKDCTVSKVKKLNIKSMSCEICVCVCAGGAKSICFCVVWGWFFGFLAFYSTRLCFFFMMMKALTSTYIRNLYMCESLCTYLLILM